MPVFYAIHLALLVLGRRQLCVRTINHLAVNRAGEYIWIDVEAAYKAVAGK